jgi:membrane protein implicated in regulation of membrane protease activity
LKGNAVKLHPAVSYTIGRFALMVAVAGLLFVAGFRNWLLVLLAIAISMPLSWFLLRTQRKQLAERVEVYQRRRSAEREELRAAMEEQEQTDVPRSPE